MNPEVRDELHKIRIIVQDWLYQDRRGENEPFGAHEFYRGRGAAEMDVMLLIDKTIKEMKRDTK